MAKMVKFHEDALEAIGRGIKTVARSLAVTFGPQGQNVVLQSETGSFLPTKESSKIVEHIVLKDKFENTGASLLKDLLAKMAISIGEGSTTTALLVEALFIEALAQMKAGAHPFKLKRGIEKGVEKALALLKQNAQPIETYEELMRVAISFTNDANLGRLIAEALTQVGKEGFLSFKESKGVETFIKLEKGISFEGGYVSPYFTRQNMSVQFEEGTVFIVGKKLSTMLSCVPFLEYGALKGPLLLIVREIEKEALDTFVLNQVKGTVSICVVEPMGSAEEKQNLLEHLAILTGATILSEKKEADVERSLSEVAGFAKNIRVSKEKTYLEGEGESAAIDALAEILREQIKQELSVVKRQKRKQELARILGAMGVIYVGGSSELEIKEKKEKLAKGLCRVERALSEGILPGGGVSYLRAAEGLCLTLCAEKEEQLGVDIVKKALLAPLIALVSNCGERGEEIVEKIAEKEGAFGYNGTTREFTQDVIKEGIIDSLFVLTRILESVSSFVTMLLTISCAVVKEVKEEPQSSSSGVEEMSDGF